LAPVSLFPSPFSKKKLAATQRTVFVRQAMLIGQLAQIPGFKSFKTKISFNITKKYNAI